MTQPIKRLKARVPKIKALSEMDRILSMPQVSNEPTEEDRERFSRLHVLARPFAGQCTCPQCQPIRERDPHEFRLLPDQVAGLRAFENTGNTGAFCNIPVGGGKTGLSILLASKWNQMHPGTKSMLLIPPDVFRQFFNRDLPWARKHLVVTVPWFPLGRTSAKKRRTLAKSGMPGCYILPYSCLSTLDTQEILESINPKFIIADEAHFLQSRSGKKSARAKRFWAFVDRTRPKGVAMSGTMTNRDILDYHKLLRWTLNDKCPMPRSVGQAVGWSEILSSNANVSEGKVQRELGPLLEWAGLDGHSVADARAAYQKRLHTAPGFVPPRESELGIGMLLKAWEDIREPGPELSDMLSQAENFMHPDGTFLKYGLEKHQLMQELSSGFYFRRYWPEDHPLTPKAKARFEREQQYVKELNKFFQSQRIPRPGLDTPLGVGNHHSRSGRIAGWEHLYDLWTEYHALDDPNLPSRISEPVKVDDFKIGAAVDWALHVAKGKLDSGGILWVWHRPMAVWLAHALTEAGLGDRVVLKGRGEDWSRGDGTETKFCVASIEAHCTGKNLQHHRNQIVVQMPRMAQKVEQMMGRTHRTGQKAENLVYYHLIHTEFDHQQFAATLADAAYDTETLGGRRKLLQASYDPPPKEYPEDFLRARGFRLHGEEE